VKALAAFVLPVLLSATVQADLVIVQKVDGAGQSGEQTIRIKGDKARTDLAQQVSVITDGATGEGITLMHAQRSYFKVTAAQAKSMMDQLKKQRGDGEAPKLQPTGKKEKIGAYECEVFTATLGELGVTYWIAKTFPNYQSVLAQMEKLQGGAISAMGRGVMPDLRDFPGMPMKTEMELGGKKVSTTVTSVKEENVDPAIFAIPKDYKEAQAQMPDLQLQK
jgi:hypothetical protein